jgi:GWxTD domain-containing protein
MTIANALGWSLVHLIWEGAIIALLLALALCFAKSSHMRYLAACSALTTTLAAFAITLIHLMPTDAGLVGHVPALRAALPGMDSDLFVRVSEQPVPIALPPWITPLWLVGVALFQLRALGGWIAVWRLRRTGVCVAAPRWQERLNELATGMRVARPVAMLQSSLAEVPVVVGHLRPVILMPLGLLAGLPCEQVESILMHELAHVRRHDYLVNLLQTLAESLLFYHPAVWWISSVIRAERENCCDDLAAGANGDARRYAAALAALAETRWNPETIAMAANGGSLLKRIRRLLRQPEGPRAGVGPLFTASLIVIASGVGLMGYQANQAAQAGRTEMARPIPASLKPEQPVTLLAQAQVKRVAQQAAPAAPAKEAESVYSKWLKEDAAYIITDAERAAFKRLGTDEERERFIEQFWERRDPTPGTIENEFKEEHYRRLAMANARYTSTSGLPGWKTDRGRIYITYGPADEIESHPAGGGYQRPPEQGGGATTVYPFEQWKYRFIDGIGTNVIIEFVDKDRNGEYRMTMDPNEKELPLGFVKPARWPNENPSVFASVGTGPQVIVEVRGDRTLAVNIPINPDAAEFHELMRITRPSQRPVASRQHQGRLCGNLPVEGCLARPVHRIEWSAIEPGLYSLSTTVKDYPSKMVHTYTTEFAVR